MTQGPRPIRRRGNSVFADERHLGDPSCASFEHLLGFATVIVNVDEEMDEMVDGEVASAAIHMASRARSHELHAPTSSSPVPRRGQGTP